MNLNLTFILWKLLDFQALKYVKVGWNLTTSALSCFIKTATKSGLVSECNVKRRAATHPIQGYDPCKNSPLKLVVGTKMFWRETKILFYFLVWVWNWLSSSVWGGSSFPRGWLWGCFWHIYFLNRMTEWEHLTVLVWNQVSFTEPSLSSFLVQVYVATFAISSYASTYYRAGSKPFNPVLGETYECDRPDKGFRFIAEQVEVTKFTHSLQTAHSCFVISKLMQLSNYLWQLH